MLVHMLVKHAPFLQGYFYQFVFFVRCDETAYCKILSRAA